jgi:hypothetical protein
MISKTYVNHRFWKRVILLTAALIASQGGTYLVLSSLGIAGQAFSSLTINTVFLLTCVGRLRGYAGPSPQKHGSFWG